MLLTWFQQVNNPLLSTNQTWGYYYKNCVAVYVDVCVCMCLHEGVFVCRGVHVSSWDNFQQLFLSFYHMSPKSGALRLGSSHFLPYRGFYQPQDYVNCPSFFQWQTSTCFPTLNLQLPRHHMTFKVSQVITLCFFFQLILQVSYYLSWTSTCCFSFTDIWGKNWKKNPTFSSYCKISFVIFTIQHMLF